MDRPEISVIIPAYNCATYVRDAVDCVLTQTVRNVEVVVVNDGSTDDTCAVMQAFAADHRVRYVEQGNGGLPNARNAGVSVARADLFVFLDADDLFAPNALELMHAAIEKTNAAWCVTSLLRVNSTSRIVRRTVIPDDPVLGILKSDFISRAPMFRRGPFYDIGRFDAAMTAREDWDINIRAILAGLPFAYVDEPVYIYKAREGSLSRETMKMLTYTERLLRKHHKRLADAGDKQVAGIYAESMWDLARRYFYGPRHFRRTGACIAESVKYDASLRRLLHPVQHWASSFAHSRAGNSDR